MGLGYRRVVHDVGSKILVVDDFPRRKGRYATVGMLSRRKCACGKVREKILRYPNLSPSSLSCSY